MLLDAETYEEVSACTPQWDETVSVWSWVSVVQSARRERLRGEREALDPRAALARRERTQKVRAERRAADTLSATQRRAVLFRARRGLRAGQIARLLGLPFGAVRDVVAEGART